MVKYSEKKYYGKFTEILKSNIMNNSKLSYKIRMMNCNTNIMIYLIISTTKIINDKTFIQYTYIINKYITIYIIFAFIYKK